VTNKIEQISNKTMLKLKTSISPSKKTAKLLPITLIGVGLTAAMNLPVLAADVMYQANICSPNKNSVNLIDRSQFGIHNTSNLSTASIQCPLSLPFDASLKVTGVYLTGYDRHPALNISCTLVGIGLDGGTLWSRSTSSSGSGQAFQFFPVLSPPSTFTAAMNLSCTLPPTTTAGASHLTTIRVITTP
jgi:hypothetical protein